MKRDKLIRTGKVLEILGSDRKFLDKLIKNGELVPMEVNGRFLYSEKEVYEYIEKLKKERDEKIKKREKITLNHDDIESLKNIWD